MTEYQYGSTPPSEERLKARAKLYGGDMEKAKEFYGVGERWYRYPLVDGEADYDAMEANVEAMCDLPKHEWAYAEGRLLQKLGLTGWVRYLYFEEVAPRQTFEAGAYLRKQDDKEEEGWCPKCHAVCMKLTFATYCEKHTIEIATESAENAIKGLPVTGSLVLQLKAPDDCQCVVIKDKKVLAGYYMSSRGAMWQAGAFVWDSPNQSGQWLTATNFRSDDPLGEWMPGLTVCSSIGYDIWNEVCNAAGSSIVDFGPRQFWADAPTPEQWQAQNLETMKQALAGYNKGEKRVERLENS